MAARGNVQHRRRPGSGHVHRWTAPRRCLGQLATRRGGRRPEARANHRTRIPGRPGERPVAHGHLPRRDHAAGRRRRRAGPSATGGRRPGAAHHPRAVPGHRRGLVTEGTAIRHRTPGRHQRGVLPGSAAASDAQLGLGPGVGPRLRGRARSHAGVEQREHRTLRPGGVVPGGDPGAQRTDPCPGCRWRSDRAGRGQRPGHHPRRGHPRADRRQAHPRALPKPRPGTPDGPPPAGHRPGPDPGWVGGHRRRPSGSPEDVVPARA